MVLAQAKAIAGKGRIGGWHEGAFVQENTRPLNERPGGKAYFVSVRLPPAVVQALAVISLKP